jgi:hypothetical protein
MQEKSSVLSKYYQQKIASDRGSNKKYRQEIDLGHFYSKPNLMPHQFMHDQLAI